jgi:hypothetical protein
MDFAQPLPYTLLSAPRYAEILGINPAHFAGGVGDNCYPINSNRCNDVWPRYSWQHADSVSQFDLLTEIKKAEADIAEQLGWWPAPTWIEEDVQQFPRPYRRGLYGTYGRNVRAHRRSVFTTFAKVIAPGQRATTLIEAGATVTLSDEDGDGFSETATVTTATTITDVNELKVFFAGTAADPRWQVRHPKSITADGATATFVFDAWRFIDPDLHAAPPDTSGFSAIDLDSAASYVATADVYRVYNDTTATSAQLVWEPTPRATTLAATGFCLSASEGNDAALVTQDGVLHIRDPELGIVVPQAATYDDDDAQWNQTSFSEGRDPDFVKLWYMCGEIGRMYTSGFKYDPLPDKWAKAIAQIATARLERNFQACGNAAGLARKWQLDVADIEDAPYRVTESDLGNPFGTRYGEILAWRTVKNERRKVKGGGAI